MRTNLRRQLAALVGAIGLALAPWLWTTGAAQDRDTVWTKVSAQGTSITLKWNKDHPWDAELNTGGVQLVARYRVSGRDVAQMIARANAPARNERSLQFALPAELPGASASTVCLLFQMPNRRALPIRRSNTQNGDTAGFRYEPWEAQVRQKVELRDATDRVAKAERAVNTAVQNVASQQAIVKQHGWRDVASCDTASATSADVRTRPYGVVEPGQQDDAARRVCVYRVWRSRQVNDRYIRDGLRRDLAEAANAQEAMDVLRGVFSEASQLPELARAVMSTADADLTQRRAQAEEFTRDWDRLSPSSADYLPQVRGASDVLGWTPAAGETAFRVFGPELARQMNLPAVASAIPLAGSTEQAGVAGAALDAYSGCLEDARAQLAIQYENWEGLRSAAPQRAAAASAFFARECHQDFNLLAQLMKTAGDTQSQLTREKENLQRASTATRALPTASQDLNTSVCN